MKVGSVNNKQNSFKKPAFKARVDIKFNGDFVGFLVRQSPKNTANFSQGIIDAVGLLKKAAPKIGSDSDVFTLRGGKMAKEGWLDLDYNGQNIGIIKASENPRGGMDYNINKVSNGTVSSSILFPRSKQEWKQFFVKDGETDMVYRNLWDEKEKRVIKTEQVLPEEKLLELLELKTGV